MILFVHREKQDKQKTLEANNMTTLKIEHDRLENFIKNYTGKLSLNYEILRLRDLKILLKRGLK